MPPIKSHIIEEIRNEGRVPPQVIDIEMAVLGAILLEKDAIFSVLEIIDDTAFYKTSHQHIFKAMVTLAEKGSVIDLITTTEELRRAGHLDEVGGPVYLAELIQKTTSAANVEYHAKIVLEKAMMRGLITAGTEMSSRAFNETEEPQEIIESLDIALIKLNGKMGIKESQHIKDVGIKVLEKLEKVHGGEEKTYGIETGLKEIDYSINGLKPGHLYIVSGLPSMGKTAFMLTVTRNIVKRGIPMAWFSIEMSAEQIMMRLQVMETGYAYNTIESARLDTDQWSKLTNATGRISSWPLIIDDASSPTIHQIRSRTKRLFRENKVKVIVVDYLGLMNIPRKERRDVEIGDVPKELKAIAKELNIASVLITQLNRDSGKEKRKPILQDLRDSGEIEQHADEVIFVYRDKDSKTSEAELIIAKQRSGEIGTVPVDFIKKRMLFENKGTQHFEETLPPAKDPGLW